VIRQQLRVALALCAIVSVSWIGGCRSAGPEADPRYRATQSVMEVVALVRKHTDDDTYRRPPARDFTGKNVFRTAFARLESLEQSYASKFSSGYLIDAITFAKARTLERIGEYDLAEKAYRRVAALDSSLARSAKESAKICVALRDARTLEPEANATPEQAMELYERRAQNLERLLEGAEAHYQYVIREELERTDRDRARYFGARRLLDPALDPMALQQYQKLVSKHPESKLRYQNQIELADFYASLAREYTWRYPPTSLGFDAPTFDEYALSATRLYESVSQQDGTVEKIEATRKLEAFIAYTLTVYEDKLPL
jgi:tetratricopeptide (TPR) repeat protein